MSWIANERSDRLHRRTLGADRIRVVHRERPALLQTVRHLVREIDAGPDAAHVDRVAAERLDALAERTLEAVHERHHADHGADSHDDAEQGQQRAQPIRDQRARRHPERLAEQERIHQLLVPQRFDRIEACGSPRGIRAEEDADERRHEEPCDDGRHTDRGGQRR